VSAKTIALLAALTYGSRALPMIVLPPPSSRLRAALDRIPAPLFAGLAAISLIDSDGAVVSGPILLAAAGAVVGAASRSLIVVLLGGLAGYLVGAALA
jgi:branched-subunit amino acid transport protein